MKQTKIAILAPECALAWTIMGPLDLLHSSETIKPIFEGDLEPEFPSFQIAVVGRSMEPVQCFKGARILPDVALSDASYRPDAVIIPTIYSESSPFGRPGWSSPWRPFIDWMKSRHEQGAMLCAISTGTALLAETGLLEGKKATAHWTLLESMSASHPGIRFVRGVPVVEADASGRIRTMGAGTCWQSMILALVAKYASSGRAAALARLFSIHYSAEAPGDKNLFIPTISHGDQRVLKAQKMISQAYREPDALTRAFEASCLGRRTYERRFKRATGLSPLAYLQQIRLQKARLSLESTNHTIEDIASGVGYTDVAHFRSLFRRTLTVSPNSYRERHSLNNLLCVSA